MVPIVTVAIIIVAAFAGGGAYYASARAGAGAWLSMTLALILYGLIVAIAPRAI